MSSLRWKRFFVDSGLPSEACENYAVIFAENRIGFDMLEELSKEILYDMGIKKMGDVISIMRHAKAVHSSSYREKLFAKDDIEAPEEKHNPQSQSNTSASSIKDTFSKVTKADSTMSNDNNSVKKPVSVDRRIIIPQRAINAIRVSNNATTVSSNKVSAKLQQAEPLKQKVSRIVAPLQEPVIIRNVAGLSTIVSGLNSRLNNSTFNANRKRVEAPGDEVETVFLAMPETKIAKTSSSTQFISNPQVRNRVEAQSRLTNQKRDITRILTSNTPTIGQITPRVSPEKSRSPLSSVRSRLTLTTPADSTTITINRNQPGRLEANNNIRKSNSSSNSNFAKKNVKSRLGPAPKSSIQDRLGNKSGFTDRRVGSSSAHHKSSNSVFKRLGA